MPLAVDLSAVTASDGTFSAAGATAWLTVKDRTATLTGIASAAQGGTGIAYFTAAGPTVARTYTFPDANATIARTDAANTFTGIQTFSTPIATASVATMSATVGGGVPTPPNNTTTFLRGDGTFATPAGAATLNGITAATGAVTIANGNNTGIIWNWANTTDSTVAFTFGETSAATNGTSTTGIPNQVLLRLDTLAASTQSPLSVYSRGTHVFSVSPTSPQLLANSGSASLPTYSFAAGVTTGMYYSASALNFTVLGVKYAIITTPDAVNGRINIINDGAFNQPAFTDNGSQSGFCVAGTTYCGVSMSQLENSRWTGASGTQAYQMSNAGAVTTGYAVNLRKSRGTVASPTVITTGDDLATISGQAYVGATNTWRTATTITFDSTGTISDATTGVGGIIRFGVMLQGTDTIAQEVARLEQTGIFTTINKIYPGTDAKAFQTSCGLYANTGAPNNANGADGDFFFRADGGALTTIYQRRAGTWTGLI